ncbi:hypothetical protein MMC14_002172 [Varicellaria rhodocarpa]|nr:hypothetical protein [Varicellaria rhodocarpa]
MPSTESKTSTVIHDVAVARQKLAGSTGPLVLTNDFYALKITAFPCLRGSLYGFNQGVFGGVLAMDNFKRHMGQWDEDQIKKGWDISASTCGLYTILMHAGLFCLGVLIQCLGVTPFGPAAIILGRLISGLGTGALARIVPLYVAECAPPEARGLPVGLQATAIMFSYLLGYWIDFGTNYIGGTAGTQTEAAWFIPLALQFVPALILMIGIIFMPFTPRSLIHHNPEDDARKALTELRGITAKVELIEIELLEIKTQSLFEKRVVIDEYLHLEKFTAWNTFKLYYYDQLLTTPLTPPRQLVSISSLFRTKVMFRRVILATMIMFFAQWTGINGIMYCAPQIFAGLGLSSVTTSLLASGILGIVMFLPTVPAVMYVDELGRKPILYLGPIAVGARPYGVALAVSADWMNNFIIGQVTPIMFEKLQWGTFVVFGALTFLGAGLILIFVPETKDLTLEEIDSLFGDKRSATADLERMEAIKQEIGLKELLYRASTEVVVAEEEKS